MFFLIAVIIAVGTPTPNPYRDGPTIYAQECMSCHGDQGQGSGGVPNLSGNGGVTADNPDGVIAIVKHGKGSMPAFGDKLSDVEIAAVVSFIRTAWGNEGTSVGVYQVDAVH
jgi:mono/diheme cytochrome c family protein